MRWLGRGTGAMGWAAYKGLQRKRAILRVIAFETLVVSICASDMSKGKQLSEKDLQRMQKAAQRIQEAARYANV